MKFAMLALAWAPLFAQTPNPTEIMNKVAANIDASVDARRQYVYQQLVRSSLVRSNGDLARRERREYSVVPGTERTEKELKSFQGEYRKGKQMIAYSEPGFKYKDMDIDGDFLSDLTSDLVDDKKSRDGIPESLFPLGSKYVSKFKYTFKGESVQGGRRAYQIYFEPIVKEKCIQIGSDNEGCSAPQWVGDAWIDAEELQPVRIQTDLAFKMPWGVRVFLGTNLKQTGFSISYTRLAENVWFPATYGTEFKLNVLWGYKRTITLSMESSGFRKADADSIVKYDPVQ